MAERTTARAKRQEAPKQAEKEAAKGARKTASKAEAGKAVQSAVAGPTAPALGDAELAKENQRLRAELAVAHERITELESKHTDITNRIAWVIDSLHNLDE